MKTNDAQTQRNAKAALAAAKAKATEILSVASSTHLAADHQQSRANGDECGVATVASVLQQQQSTAM